MRILSVFIFVLAAALAGLAATANDEPPLDLKPAVSAADSWLATLDSGRYSDSWERTAQVFKDSAAQARWEPAVQGARQALGVVIGRKVRSMRYVNAVPNAPAGHYVIIEFETHFENRPLTTETVTPMRDKDGQWRVAGYYLK